MQSFAPVKIVKKIAKMAQRGSAPGERRGGRGPGSLNKSTIVRAAAMERATTEIGEPVPRRSGKRAIDVLEQFMSVFAGMAAVHQPSPPSAQQKNPHGDSRLFVLYADMATKIAGKLAPFQDPTYSTISVGPPPPPPRDESRNFTFTIFDERTRSFVVPGTDEAIDAAIGSELVRMTNGGDGHEE